VIDDKLLLNVTVLKESSAADIDLEVTETEVQLSSKNYKMTHTFAQKIDADSVKAKFSKKAKTLTLTFCIVGQVEEPDLL